MPSFLGIDGGGTRTAAWIADEPGRVLARSTAGPSNPLKVGFRMAERELLRAARLAVRRARMGGRVLDAVCAGLAGVDRPPVHRRLLRWLRRSIRARAYLLTSDAAIALRAALGDVAGAVVVSGTGSIAYGRNPRGQVLRAGGWGAAFDDAGSGYDLGRKAIAAALWDYDGRGPRTRLTRMISKALKLADITRVVLHPLAPHQIAGLFPLVLEAERRRDTVARRLCEEAGRDLATLAVALIKRLGRTRSLPVVCAGGVFQSSPRIRRSFARHLRRQLPRVGRVLLLRRPPVEGALALARELARTGGKHP